MKNVQARTVSLRRNERCVYCIKKGKRGVSRGEGGFRVEIRKILQKPKNVNFTCQNRSGQNKGGKKRQKPDRACEKTAKGGAEQNVRTKPWGTRGRVDYL